MTQPTIKVTLLDGTTREFDTWDEYRNVRDSLTLHSWNDQPAIIHYYDNGSIWYQYWYKEGKYHREGDLPAIIIYYSNDSIEYQAWYKQGKKVTKEEAKKLSVCYNGHNYVLVTACGVTSNMCTRCYKREGD